MILISKLLNIPFKRFRIWYAVFVNFGLHFIHVSYILWISFFSNFKFSCILLVSCRKVSTKCQSLLFSSLFDAPNFFGISLLGQLNLIHIYNKNFFFTYHLKWIFHPKLMPKQKNEATYASKWEFWNQIFSLQNIFVLKINMLWYTNDLKA